MCDIKQFLYMYSYEVSMKHTIVIGSILEKYVLRRQVTRTLMVTIKDVIGTSDGQGNCPGATVSNLISDIDTGCLFFIS